MLLTSTTCLTPADLAASIWTFWPNQSIWTQQQYTLSTRTAVQKAVSAQAQLSQPLAKAREWGPEYLPNPHCALQHIQATGTMC
jgi:hypothetical protein